MAVPTFTLSSGYKIPVIGLGTATAAEKELEDALDAALEIGYRHIDTAQIYQNEHVIGRVLKRWFDSGKLKRNDIFITTKLPGGGIHPDRVQTYLKESMNKLQLDYIDLYLIHFPIHTTESDGGPNFFSVEPLPTDLVGTWKKLEEQVELGRIRSIGVSNFNKEQVAKIISSSRIKPAANQIELHVYLQQPELVKYLQDNGIVVVSYASLGKPGMNTYLQKNGLPALYQNLDILSDSTAKKIAEKHNKSPAHIVLKFLIQKNIAVIPKSITPKRLKDNFDVFDFTLDHDDIKILEGLNRGEEARLTTFRHKQSFIDHPEYPFPKPKE